MATAPSTIKATGFFDTTRAGAPAGEAVLRMSSATKGTLDIGADRWTLTGDPAKKTIRGKKPGSSIALKIVNGSTLKGTVDGDAIRLTRSVLRPIPAAEMATSDPGPFGPIKTIIDATPDYLPLVGDATAYWYAFGPVLYRGRLDGSARVLVIASDPGPTECLPFVRRTLVGDSGQKAQGFLAKLGLTRSYVLVNAFAVAMRPSFRAQGLKLLSTNATIQAARQSLYNALLTPAIQTIVAFGGEAHAAYDVWAASNAAVKNVPVFKLTHPSGVDRDATGKALKGWNTAVTKLRAIVTPDAGADASTPNYGAYVTEMDYARVPRWDLPKVAPAYVGDDSWGRAASPAHANCCGRPSPDDSVSLLLTPPEGQGKFLHYVYGAGKLVGAKTKSGKTVKVDQFGIPI